MTDYLARPQLPLQTLTAAVVGLSGFAFFLGACAIVNTPQQDLAYARWAKCNAPYVQLDRVDLDGRIRFRFSNMGASKRSCNASPKLAARGRRFPRPWASPLPVAHERPTRPAPRSGAYAERREGHTHARVQKLAQPEVTEIRTWGAYERIAVRRG
jgi:hypothetical protein